MDPMPLAPGADLGHGSGDFTSAGEGSFPTEQIAQQRELVPPAIDEAAIAARRSAAADIHLHEHDAALRIQLEEPIGGPQSGIPTSDDDHDNRSKPPAAGIGYDISYPQCASRYPPDPAFGIVGVNRGIVFSANPCLGASSKAASQLAWAGPNAQLYANTGNPGPQLSSHWPSGQTAPRECATQTKPDPDTADCAYDYGWNAASDSYANAVAAYVSLGWAPPGAARTPVANHWWLDVETANSWREDPSLNVAAL